jgi:hypothetical protein
MVVDIKTSVLWSFTLNMETARSFETSVRICDRTRRHMPVESNHLKRHLMLVVACAGLEVLVREAATDIQMRVSWKAQRVLRQ